jgi:hypothetical protein
MSRFKVTFDTFHLREDAATMKTAAVTAKAAAAATRVTKVKPTNVGVDTVCQGSKSLSILICFRKMQLQ